MCEQFAREHAINEAVLRDPRFNLDGAEVDDVVERVRRGIEEGAAMLKDRVKQGRVVEGTAICGQNMSASPILR